MRTLLFFLIFGLTQLLSAEVEYLNITNQELIVIKDNYNLYKTKGRVVKFYHEESNKDLKFLKSFILDESSGGCSARAYQRGVYDINGSNITFYTKWSRSGKAYDLPQGVMIESYALKENGSLQKLSNQLYIESSQKGHDNDSGMKFLFNPPKNPTEEKHLAQYIRNVEAKYDGDFLQGEQAKQLQEQVEKALNQAVKKMWRSNSN